MHIAICLPAADASPWIELFRAAIPEATFDLHEPNAQVRTHVPRADYAIAAWPSDTFFVEQPSPKAVFTLSAGVRHVLRMAHLPSAPVVRIEDAGMAAQMVRYAVTAAMQFVQRLHVYRAQQHARVWQQHAARAPSDVECGVLGLGVMGEAIARALVAQGFKVRGYSRGPKSIEGVRCLCGDVDAFLSGVDVLVNVLPSTGATAGLLGRAALLRLNDGAYLVNMGRGDILVDEDLVALIDSGKLGGATLDVFRPEPLPASHPFWSRPTITMTPHVAGLTVPDEAVSQIAHKIRAMERGEPVTGVVDVAQEY